MMMMVQTYNDYSFIPPNRWIVCLTGFGRKQGSLTGLEILHAILRTRYSDKETAVLLKSWKDDPAEVAERIWRMRRPFEEPEVILIGYSYGGYSATLVAKELRKRGIKVKVLLLVDAVWRPYTSIPSFLSLWPYWKIKVVDSVDKVISWRQKENLPKGHRIVCKGKHTQHIELELNQLHEYCDSAIEVYQRAIKEAA